MKLLSYKIGLYLYRASIQVRMECGCHIWAGAPSCCLDMLDKVQKQMCRSAGPSITASFEPLGHRRNVASLSLLIGITLVDIHLN